MSTTYAEMRSPEEVAMDRKVLNRVLAGIEILKEEYGDDWVDKINLDTLRLCNAHQCVLGQIGASIDGGNYHGQIGRLKTKFGDEIGAGYEHGFAAMDNTQYAALDRVWPREITRLRAERSSS